MTRPLRILIIEDDPVTVMTIEESLQPTGHTVCGKASDYASAIALMKSASPDIALVDIQLKGQADGIVTAQDLLRIKPIPLLYLTAITDEETYNRAKKTNPIGFLHKPFRPRELAMQIDLALHNYYEGHDADVASTTDYLYVPDRNAKFRIYTGGIVYIQADRGYVELVLTADELKRLKKKSNPLVITVGIGRLLSYLPDTFYRLSHSLAINLEHLDRVETSRVFLGDHELSLPEGSHAKLMNALNTIRPPKRR